MIHKPVLLNEVLEVLNPQPGQLFIDGTANGGGHTLAILERIKPNGKILAIDKDRDLVDRLQAISYKLQANEIVPVCGSYGDIKKIADDHGFYQVSGILLDLGYSSHHLERSGRGFSFQKDEPLIMRYETESDLGTGLTARDAVNQFSERDLADIFYRYGEERFSRRIAKSIYLARKKKKIETTKELADIVAFAYPKRFFYKIHPATKVFQALRVFVNNELGELENALPQALETLAPGGKIAVISFHSLEDRIVKNFFKAEKEKGIINIITKKPLISGDDEIRDNPRARSAKMRVAEKI
ncbi:MAG: 16S rRNA (cytosine(1402)-N(4))-methyltransferase [Candidatus Terrybacteria bacterium RIFCSPLOWO2_01_FULL_48_14]|nr:MAG: 16S rRNA (cytosine(1402)-N(4))-methyltransferase [Candidatus Terrybacteria bacterium RIFCSPLOWO2_01_FULL_48_14]